VKLLFDQNLSPKLVGFLQAEYPGSNHASLMGMGSADDAQIWAAAKELGFCIVTKDQDFNQLAILRGHPLRRRFG